MHFMDIFYSFGQRSLFLKAKTKSRHHFTCRGKKFLWMANEITFIIKPKCFTVCTRGDRKKSTEYISRVQSNMAAKGHTPSGRLKGQTETFNRVKCAVWSSYKIMYAVNLWNLLRNHHNGSNDTIMISVIGTVIRLWRENRDEWQNDNSAIRKCRSKRSRSARSDLDTVVTDICRRNRAALFLSSWALMRSTSLAKSLLDPHCDKCYLSLSTSINV